MTQHPDFTSLSHTQLFAIVKDETHFEARQHAKALHFANHSITAKQFDKLIEMISNYHAEKSEQNRIKPHKQEGSTFAPDFPIREILEDYNDELIDVPRAAELIDEHYHKIYDGYFDSFPTWAQILHQ